MEAALKALSAVDKSATPSSAALVKARSAAIRLITHRVTVDGLLAAHDAGRLVRRLSRHDDRELARACGALYRTWRAAVVEQLRSRDDDNVSDDHGAAAERRQHKRAKLGTPPSPAPVPAPAAAAPACDAPVPGTTARMEAAMQSAPHGTSGSKVILVHCRKQRLRLHEGFRQRYGAFPEALHYSAKTWMLLQDQCNTAFFFAYEFGPKTEGPNAGCVYLKMVDSVTFDGLWRPSHHAALQAYVEHAQALGYSRFYVWACSMQAAADQGVFYAYPDKPAGQAARATQGANSGTMQKLCAWYEQLANRVVVASAAREGEGGEGRIRLVRWSPRTPLNDVPCFGLGKSWPFSPHFGARASAAEVEDAEQRAQAAMLKHGRSVFVFLLRPEARDTRLPGRGARAEIHVAPEPCPPVGKTVCAHPRDIVSFCCRHGLSFATEALARKATQAVLHAVRYPQGKLDDGCCRTCNVCNNYINAKLDALKHAAPADPAAVGAGGQREFDVCGRCDTAEPWHMQQFLAANPGFTVSTGGWRSSACTLPEGMCSCYTRRLDAAFSR
eukprot:g2185.t1